MNIKVNGIYKHFKGDYYIVENIAIDSDTEKEVVIYRALYEDGKLYVRSATDFLKEVNKNNQKYRFELQSINSKNKD